MAKYGADMRQAVVSAQIKYLFLGFPRTPEIKYAENVDILITVRLYPNNVGGVITYRRQTPISIRPTEGGISLHDIHGPTR